MARDNDSKIVWFFVGAAVGAGVALLYAPQTGDRTRRIIKQQARKGRDVVADHGRDLYDKGRDLYDKGRDIADDAAAMFDRGRHLVEKELKG